MSIFPSISMTPFAASMFTAAPMTVLVTSTPHALYGLAGGVCFMMVNINFTIGGVLSANPVSILLPVGMASITGGAGFACTVVNGGVFLTTRGRFLSGTDSADVFKSTDGGDVVWAAGPSTITMQGFFPVG